ncbi:hypothetical protein OSTOST_23088 [Ostertagia ostertagi]
MPISVGNLPYRTSEDAISNYFSRAGQVTMLGSRAIARLAV